MICCVCYGSNTEAVVKWFFTGSGDSFQTGSNWVCCPACRQRMSSWKRCPDYPLPDSRQGNDSCAYFALSMTTSNIRAVFIVWESNSIVKMLRATYLVIHCLFCCFCFSFFISSGQRYKSANLSISASNSSPYPSEF